MFKAGWGGGDFILLILFAHIKHLLNVLSALTFWAAKSMTMSEYGTESPTGRPRVVEEGDWGVEEAPVWLIKWSPVCSSREFSWKCTFTTCLLYFILVGFCSPPRWQKWINSWNCESKYTHSSYEPWRAVVMQSEAYQMQMTCALLSFTVRFLTAIQTIVFCETISLPTDSGSRLTVLSLQFRWTSV